VLNGTVKGDVQAGERVELGATARVIGNVHYRLIEMAIGAEVNGKLVHEGAQPALPPAWRPGGRRNPAGRTGCARRLNAAALY
jgi:cytoskeletal protein CcmA (bactofilin family)